MSNFDLHKIIQDAYKQAMKERGHVNILIAGRSGVGKSTLINSVFEGDFVRTGVGKPVTPGTREIKKEGIPLSIFDTRGLEMANFKETDDQLRKFIAERRQSVDPATHIHLAWVCIAEDLRRVEDAEHDLVEKLVDFVPVVGVITKARADQGFRQTVHDLLPTLTNVIRVRALREEFDDGHVLEPMGLNDLVQHSMQLVPEAHRRAFAAAQKVDLDLKTAQAHQAVAAATVTAGGIAAAPIPFADAAVIIPVQITMIAGITTIFGLPVTEGFLSSLVVSVLGGAGGAFLGRTIVSNLLKLIPGAGSVAGGAIGAATAGVITAALGEAYIAALYTLLSNNAGATPTDQEIADAFKREFTKAISLRRNG
jgi:uncharacterized protein (DUF697 family)/energy-coupling factor transporter ATP-binding protein EcfA2